MIKCKQLYSCYYRLFQCSKIVDHIVLSLASLCNYLSKEIHTPPQPWEHLSRMIEVITCHIYQTLRQSLSQQCSQSPLNTQNRVFIQFSGCQRSKGHLTLSNSARSETIKRSINKEVSNPFRSLLCRNWLKQTHFRRFLRLQMTQ